MHDQNTWILVADGSRAVILETTHATKEKPWGKVETFEDSDAHVPHQHHDDNSPKEIGDAKFARRLAGALTSGLDAHRYKRLVLAAPPHFLGLLRGGLSTGVQACIVAAVDKHYTQLKQGELEDRLREHV